MEFTGIITGISAIASGISQTGKEWQRADYILTYDNSRPEYPKAIAFSVMNDLIAELDLQKGESYKVEIDFSVRVYEGRSYMSATAWKATPLAKA